jgi:arginyl-tRNA synthetase
MERFADMAAKALNLVLNSPVKGSDLEVPPDPKLGDFAFPCFRLAKEMRKAPPQIAKQIADELLAKNLVPEGLTLSTAGPYVNFTVEPSLVFGALLKDILQPGGGYGRLKADSRGSWVIEYSSPNVAKPLNIYHLRPTALGAALDRVGRYRGFKVISINHLGDWGKQYGMLAVAFKHFGISLDAKLGMKELVDLYVRINAEVEKNPQIEEDARAAFLKLEQGDPEITALWKKCVDISIEEFDRQYQRLGVHFDHIWGESFYKDQLAPLLKDLKARGLLLESEGAWIVPVTNAEGKELPPCILQKKDGATIYATRDLAAAIYRYDQFHFDRMTYIVGGEQKLHFEQVFSVLRQMGLPWVSKCEHIPFGLYRFKDAKMSTRKGNFITLAEVIELAKERVKTLMSERAKEHDTPAPSDDVMEAVAIGAVVFHDLHTDPVRDVEFDIEHVVDFEGETGPYLQYAHTRCLSILRKARETGKAPTGSTPMPLPLSFAVNDKLISRLGKPEELQLIKTLGQLPIHLERTLTFAKASQLAHYLIDVAKVFGAFYRECKVLDDSDLELTQARLLLVESTRIILACGLGLMGIPLPERM